MTDSLMFWVNLPNSLMMALKLAKRVKPNRRFKTGS